MKAMNLFSRLKTPVASILSIFNKWLPANQELQLPFITSATRIRRILLIGVSIILYSISSLTTSAQLFVTSVSLSGSPAITNMLLHQGGTYSSSVTYLLALPSYSTYWLAWRVDGTIIEESSRYQMSGGYYSTSTGGGSFTCPGPGVHTYQFTADSRTNFGSPSIKVIEFAVATNFIVFSQGTYNAYEGSNTVSLIVTRLGMTNGSASVQIATSNMTATAGSDYVGVTNTLSWAAGDASARTVTVTVVDDSLADGTEFFSARLFAPSGAAMGSTTSAVVTLYDNDSGSVSVTLTPTAAEVAGAMWRLDGAGWIPSGTLSGVRTGEHTVAFSSVAGWIGPESRTVMVNPNSTTNIIASYAKLDDGTVAGAVDNASLVFTLAGDASWFRQTTNTHDGVDAAQSGAIGNSQSSKLEATVTGPGTLKYWWSVSSEASYDYLTFYIDDVQQSGRISGTSGWQRMTNSISAGTHVIKWVYAKDSSSFSGDDCGRLDEVVLEVIEMALGVNPASTNFTPAAWSGRTIAVTGNVSWAATTNAAWLAVTGGASGSSNGTVTFSVAANPGTSARTGGVVVAGGGISRTCTVVQAGIPAQRIIELGGNIIFGNVVTGRTKTATLTIANSGNAALTVTSISYPSGFAGAWSGSIAASNSTNVTVTFSPVAVATYGGTITVNSDKTSGTNTISVSGNGTILRLEAQDDASFGVVSNRFGFNVNWISGRVVVVDACTNLNNPVWTPLQTNTLGANPVYFGDSKWTNYIGRFYRIRAP